MYSCCQATWYKQLQSSWKSMGRVIMDKLNATSLQRLFQFLKYLPWQVNRATLKWWMHNPAGKWISYTTSISKLCMSGKQNHTPKLTSATQLVEIPAAPVASSLLSHSLICSQVGNTWFPFNLNQQSLNRQITLHSKLWPRCVRSCPNQPSQTLVIPQGLSNYLDDVNFWHAHSKLDSLRIFLKIHG